MEKILPPSISKLHHPLPKPSMDRSMSESFMSDCSAILPRTPSSTQSNIADSEQLNTSTTEEALTPIANWAHLSLLKKDRIFLRSQLSAQQAANSEAQASVSALRRLAIRLAVNVSVKEKRIANTLRSLSQSRKNEYISSRNADERIEVLTKMWKDEERRNLELLESLERAAMLTLQYSEASSSPAPRISLASDPLSPPPSPPTRGLKYRHRPLTPTLSPSLSWDGTTPNGTVFHVHKPGDRLARAKRDSEHALKVCRSRIEALQADCLRSKETARQLDLTRVELEEEIRLYQTRVSALETSKCVIESDLHSKEFDLEASLKSATQLRCELEQTNREIAELQQCSKQDADRLKELEESKISLEERVSSCVAQIQELETNTRSLTEELRVFKERLDAAEQNEADLLRKLAEKEIQEANMEVILKGSQGTIQNLEQAVAVLESQATDYQQRISTFEGKVSWLSDSLTNSEQLKARLEGELETARKTGSELESTLRSLKEENDSLQLDLSSTRTAKAELERELLGTNGKLTQESMLRRELQTQVEALQVLKVDLEKSILDAHKKIEMLEQPDPEIQEELENLRAAKSSLEQQLTEMQQSSIGLEREFQAERGRLQAVEVSMVELEAKLKGFEDDQSQLQHELRGVMNSKSEVDMHLRDLLTSNAGLEGKLKETESRLRLAENRETDLQSKLSTAEIELDALHQTNLEFEDSESRLSEKLAMVEKELTAVRRANEELESFLEQAEQDMALVEAAVEDSETRIDVFVDRSNAKLRAARESKLKYKRRLNTRGKELEVVKGENAELQLQLEQKDNDIQSLRTNESQLRTELQERDTSIDELQKINDEFSASLQAVEEEMTELKASKHTLEQVIKTLQEKIVELDELSKRDPSPHAEEVNSTLSTEMEKDVSDPFPPEMQRPLSFTETAERIPPVTPRPRPMTHVSMGSSGGDLQWASEVERVRMLRDETAGKLKDMRQAKLELKKTLKASEEQLSRLERHTKHKHHSFFTRRTSSPASTRSKSQPPTDRRSIFSRPGTSSTAPTTPGSPSNPEDFIGCFDPLPSPRNPSSFSPIRPSASTHKSARPSTAKSRVASFSLDKKHWGDSVKSMFRRRHSARRMEDVGDGERPRTAF